MARRWVLVTNLYRVQLPRPAPGLLLNAVAPRVCVVAPRSMCSKKSKARLCSLAPHVHLPFFFDEERRRFITPQFMQTTSEPEPLLSVYRLCVTRRSP